MGHARSVVFAIENRELKGTLTLRAMDSDGGCDGLQGGVLGGSGRAGGRWRSCTRSRLVGRGFGDGIREAGLGLEETARWASIRATLRTGTEKSRP